MHVHDLTTELLEANKNETALGQPSQPGAHLAGLRTARREAQQDTEEVRALQEARATMAQHGARNSEKEAKMRKTQQDTITIIDNQLRMALEDAAADNRQRDAHLEEGHKQHAQTQRLVQALQREEQSHQLARQRAQYRERVARFC